jgi:hypothetical protein
MTESVRLSREELYTLVWSAPMRTVAKQFDISDVGLTKHCRKLSIPVPGRGYWAKKAANKPVRQIPLTKLPPNTSKPAETELRPAIEAADVAPVPARVAEQMAYEAEHPISVSESLRSPHPLVRRAKELLQGSAKHQGGFVRHWPAAHLDLHVSRDRLQRALRIADALVKAFELRGWKVTLGSDRQRKSFVTLLGHQVAFGIREPVKKIENEPAKPRRLLDGSMYTPFQNRYHDEPSGKLSFVIRSHWEGSNAVEQTWLETASTPLEQQLNAFIIGIVEYANALVERQLEREEELRVRQEAEVRWHEEQRRRATERARRTALKRQAKRWELSQRLLRYLAAVRVRAEQHPDGVASGSPIADWLEWAEAYARSLDPLNRPVESLARVSESTAQ